MQESSPSRAPTHERHSPEPEATGVIIRRAYQRYVTSVSRPAHAISLQLAFLLWELLCERRPRRVVDLGSGFSSYLLRLYASRRSPDTKVWSVDDDAGWLHRTRDFLQVEGLSTDLLMSWTDFPRPSVEFVLHDLGSMSTRARTLPDVLRLVSRGGVLVLDDVHFPSYRRCVQDTLDGAGFVHLSVREQTTDPLGRYSWLAFPASTSDRGVEPKRRD